MIKFFFCNLIFLFFLCLSAYSQIIIPEKVRQGIVIDYFSGAVLAEKNSDQKISPASMTKIMTAIIVFDQLKNKKIKLTDALLGTSYDITTLDGIISLKIPEGIQHGEILKIKGKGVPYDGSKRGDILVHILVDIPHKLSKSAKKAIEELRTEGL